MGTLEIIEEETQPGKGGEKDVPGLYARVMLWAWELTEKKEMLHEKPVTGELDRNLGITLEDMHDDWEQCDEVGQKVELIVHGNEELTICWK